MKNFSRDKKMPFWEELIFDHRYNEDIDMLERTGVNQQIITFILGIMTILAIAIAVTPA